MPDELSIHWIIDPGHGWLVVPMSEVRRTVIAPSEFSFISDDGTTAFLEEDCDAGLYLEAIGGHEVFPSRHTSEFRRPPRSFPVPA
jgi:hypothetical protein